jgi:uncharacterized membrane protein
MSSVMQVEASGDEFQQVRISGGAFPNERLCGYSDAVFAVAMTIGALWLKVTDEDAYTYSDPVDFLLMRLSAFYYFYFAFEVASVYWRAHVSLFCSVVYVDGMITLANLVCLFALTFIPFCTKVLDLNVAFYSPLFFALVISCLSLGYTYIFFYAQWNYKTLLRNAVPFDRLSIIGYLSRSIPTVFVCWLAVVWSLIPGKLGTYYPLSYVLMLLIYVTPIILARQSKRRGLNMVLQDALEEQCFGLARQLNLTDGVYSIVATIIILDIPVPTSHDEMMLQIISEYKSYAAYTVCFFIIGLQWCTHHVMFSFVKRNTEWIRFLNNSSLISISLIPFAASFAVKFNETHWGVVIFSGIITYATSHLFVMWMCICLFGSESVLDQSMIASRGWMRWVILGESLIIPVSSFLIAVMVSLEVVAFSAVVPIVLAYTFAVLLVYGILSVITYHFIPNQEKVVLHAKSVVSMTMTGGRINPDGSETDHLLRDKS